MDELTRFTLDLDLKHISDAEIKLLHDLKAKAVSAWAEEQLNLLEKKKHMLVFVLEEPKP